MPLAAASFASSASMRIADPLLPQLSAEFQTTAADASIVVTVFALAYGLAQLLFGPIGDRYGKMRVIVAMLVASAAVVSLGAFAPSLGVLAVLRLAAGVAASAIIPLSMAHIGDVVPYDQRQPVLAKLMMGMSFGLVAGQALGGILGDLLGWRPLFLLLGVGFLGVALLLVRHRGSRPLQAGGAIDPLALIRLYLALLRGSAWVRAVIACVFLEGVLFFGVFAFVGAFLHDTHAMGYSAIGVILAMFGTGGVIYAVFAGDIVRRLGQRGMVASGGAVLALCLVVIPLVPNGWLVAPAVLVIGVGFYLFHNTLQTNATQMAPDRRGAAVALFASVFFLGQALGVWLVAHAIPALGYAPPFYAAALGLVILGLWFRLRLTRLAVAT